MTINDLVDLLQPEFPGCPRSTLRDYLRVAQRKFCAEGNAWIVDDGPAVVGANTRFAEVNAPDGAEVVRIFTLRDAEGRDLVEGFDYTQDAEGRVAFARTPAGNTVPGKVVCKPAVGRDMPDALLSRWEEALKDGARGKLLMLPQPWRDPNLAAHHLALFATAQADARQQARVGFQAGSVRMHVPPFI